MRNPDASWLFRCRSAVTLQRRPFLALAKEEPSSAVDYSRKTVPPQVNLRNATLADLGILLAWERSEHIQNSIGDYDFNDWNWEQELPRNPAWRHQLIAEVQSEGNGTTPIGFIQIIDPATEETHYWGEDYAPNWRALDVWIGEEDYLGKGYGTQMMVLALRDYCFVDPSVQGVLVDPMAHNKAAHRFYQRLGFRPEEDVRFFGPDR